MRGTGNTLAYEQACNIIKDIKSIKDIQIPAETEIDCKFLNTEFTPYIEIWSTFYGSNIKNALLLIFKQAMQNTQEKQRWWCTNIDVTVIAQIDENKHMYVNQNVWEKDIDVTIPTEKHVSKRSYNEFHSEKENIEKQSSYAWERGKYQRSKKETQNNNWQKMIEEFNKKSINKSPTNEEINNTIKTTKLKVVEILDTTIVIKINNLLEKIKKTNERNKQNEIGQEIYVIIQDIYPIKSKFLEEFKKSYIHKDDKVSWMLLKLGLDPYRLNTTIKNIIADIKKRSE